VNNFFIFNNLILHPDKSILPENESKFMGTNTTKIILFLASFTLAFGIANSSQAAIMPLEIINIKPAGTGSPAIPATNRIFRAYPGIEYNIRAAVIGGVYPYSYSLLNAPSGMTINSRTGEIIWTNPQSNSGAITLNVVDSENAQASASWTITVTTSGFLFVNSNYSGTSTGSITQPFKTVLEMLEKTTSANRNDIVYIRGGNYTLAQYIDSGAVLLGWSSSGSETRPHTWIGYPGETVNINANGLIIRSNRVWFDSLNISGWGDVHHGIEVWGSENYQTIRRSKLSGINNTDSANQNQALFYAQGWEVGYYLVIQDNEWTDFRGAGAIGSIYATRKMLIENNYTYDGGYPSGHYYCTPISIKAANSYYTIRGNKIVLPSTATNLELFNGAVPDGGDYAEFVYNLVVRPSSTDDAIVHFYPYHFHMHRNTFRGRIEFIPSLSAGPIYFRENVLVGSLIEDTNVTSSNNLTGSNLFDSSYKLTGSYTQYVGSRGWQLSDGLTSMELGGSQASLPPSLPGDLNSDGIVNIFDYNLLLQNFGATDCGNVADLNGDCSVNIFDYNILLENFGRTQ
jgi:hypothetical protein